MLVVGGDESLCGRSIEGDVGRIDQRNGTNFCSNWHDSIACWIYNVALKMIFFLSFFLSWIKKKTNSSSSSDLVSRRGAFSRRHYGSVELVTKSEYSYRFHSHLLEVIFHIKQKIWFFPPPLFFSCLKQRRRIAAILSSVVDSGWRTEMERALVATLAVEMR